jgi:methylphosphotriester-DNA--protein-cysteine methyltransferase
LKKHLFFFLFFRLICVWKSLPEKKNGQFCCALRIHEHEGHEIFHAPEEARAAALRVCSKRTEGLHDEFKREMAAHKQNNNE